MPIGNKRKLGNTLKSSPSRRLQNVARINKWLRVGLFALIRTPFFRFVSDFFFGGLLIQHYVSSTEGFLAIR